MGEKRKNTKPADFPIRQQSSGKTLPLGIGQHGNGSGSRCRRVEIEWPHYDA